MKLGYLPAPFLTGNLARCHWSMPPLKLRMLWTSLVKRHAAELLRLPEAQTQTISRSCGSLCDWRVDANGSMRCWQAVWIQFSADHVPEERQSDHHDNENDDDHWQTKSQKISEVVAARSHDEHIDRMRKRRQR